MRKGKERSRRNRSRAANSALEEIGIHAGEIPGWLKFILSVVLQKP